ncbi:glutaminase A [Aestuariivirga sp.]|uniref:glutaminase A n=1 Tax=Aestuariivirga sp. TaxID=2650926 RepID=UPI003BAD82FB
MHEFDLALRRVWGEQLSNSAGVVADYIPELGRANPDDFGLAIMSVKGRLHAVGDAEKLFTIQSVSKALAFCLALQTAGYDKVISRVGFEPSGDAFNAIELDPVTQKPFNPMINAGAIAIAGLLCQTLGASAFEQVLDCFSAAAGRSLTIDDRVYRSEKETGNRNRAIAYLLLGHGLLNVDPEEALDVYFKQCSIAVSAVDLAAMGATLAHMGQQPATGAEVFDVSAVRLTLSVMFTCGMYDYAGNWACDVGIPAKSGVGGGIMGVINRQLGIASYSPRLDAKGNSLRGVKSFSTLAEEFGLHVFDCTNAGSAVAATYMA